VFRSLIALLAALLLGVTGASATGISTWSVAGHDAQDTSFNSTETALSELNVARLHVIWTAPGATSAIATDQRVYAILSAGTAPARVVVLNTVDGKNLFTFTPAMMRLSRAAGDTPSALAHPDDTLIVGSTRETVALNPHNGHLRWYVAGGATTITVSGTTVYTGKLCAGACGAAVTSAIGLTSGKPLWRRNGFLGSPVAVNGLLYAHLGLYGGITQVLNPRSGRLLGTLNLNARWLGDSAHSYAFVLPGVNPNTGAVGRAWIGQIGVNGATQWRADLGTIKEGNPALAYGDLFVPSNRHHPGVIALDARTGRYLWGVDCGVSSNLVVANHLVYVLNDTTGRLIILRTSNGSLVRTIPVPGFNNRGAKDLMVAGGRVFVLGGNGLVALGT
jgi:outer membrane protein assembly factor BamB